MTTALMVIGMVGGVVLAVVGVLVIFHSAIEAAFAGEPRMAHKWVVRGGILFVTGMAAMASVLLAI